MTKNLPLLVKTAFFGPEHRKPSISEKVAERRELQAKTPSFVFRFVFLMDYLDDLDLPYSGVWEFPRSRFQMVEQIGT